MTAVQVRIGRDHYDQLHGHLFPGDRDEHGAVILASTSKTRGRLVLHVREVHLCMDGVDYVPSELGYRAVTAQFIHRLITRARDERLVYLAVHNHHSDRTVGFSDIDLASHERGYPALLQIARGVSVGALVLGRRSMAADVWLPTGERLCLEKAWVVGRTMLQIDSGQSSDAGYDPVYDRQIRMFGRGGQERLTECRVGIVGLGGVGSLVTEYLSRLGVRHFMLIDGDRVEMSNLSRIAGATSEDARVGRLKVDVAERVIRDANRNAEVISIPEDVAKESVARRLTECDYLFLAADSMRARLVVNAIVHQYLIPAVQLGAKVRSDNLGRLADVMSVNRPLRPGAGCLWCNQLIDSTELARESKSDADRRAQAYGTHEPNPSVITLNAIAAAHGVNDFMFAIQNLTPGAGATVEYEHFHFLTARRVLVTPRRDPTCSECSIQGRYARGDSWSLPCIEG